MALKSLESFQAFMEAKEFRVAVVDDDGKVARVGFNLDATTIEILLFFSDDEKDVHFVGRDFVKIPADKQDLAYKLCNDCNSEYRWMKFVWSDEYKNITVQADAVIEPNTCAEECYEIVMRMCSIVDEAYPVFMKALWA